MAERHIKQSTLIQKGGFDQRRIHSLSFQTKNVLRRKECSIIQKATTFLAFPKTNSRSIPVEENHLDDVIQPANRRSKRDNNWAACETISSSKNKTNQRMNLGMH